MRNLRRNGVMCVTLALVMLAGCKKPAVPTDGGAAGAKPEKARKDAEALALDGANGGAAAQAKALPQIAVKRDLTMLNGRIAVSRETWRVSLRSSRPAEVKAAEPKTPDAKATASAPTGPPVRPGAFPVLRERVSSVPCATEAEADEEALKLAAELVEQKLAELDPPVRHKITPEEVRTEYLRPDTRTVRTPNAEQKEALAREGVTTNTVYVEIDVELTAEQVRDLRARDRLSLILRGLGGLCAVALAGVLFLRGDDWTRGARTTWLALAAVALAGGGVAAAVFV